MNVYLDNAATTPLSNEIKSYVSEVLDIYGNPSSTHEIGQKAKELLNKSRKSVANFINADTECIYFTSGGSASNTLAIRGYYELSDCCILYSPIAHKSILKQVQNYGKAVALRVDNKGNIILQDLENKLACFPAPILVIVDYANSEIGTIQNVKEIIRLTHKYGGIVYLDCTGSISQIKLDVEELDVDMAGFSAHKIGGLKGCGILYRKKHIQLNPLIYGSQEEELVGGTENIIGIASLAKAVDCYKYSSISSHNRDYVLSWLKENVGDCYMVGARENRLPHNLYICFRGVDAESLLLALDLYGIYVSSGSACNSRNVDVSATLKAIEMDEIDTNSCIRLSFSGKETHEELDYVCVAIKNCVETIRNCD